MNIANHYLGPRRDAPHPIDSSCHPLLTNFDFSTAASEGEGPLPRLYHTRPRRYRATQHHVRFWRGVLHTNLAEKLPRWYRLLDVLRSGMTVNAALRETPFSSGTFQTWINFSMHRRAEYFAAIGERRNWRDEADALRVIELVRERPLLDALAQANMSDTTFYGFIRFDPALRARYEEAVGHPYRWLRPVTEADWQRFFTEVPAYGTARAMSLNRRFSLRGSVAHRLAHDGDFRQQVWRVYTAEAELARRVPTTPQLADCLVEVANVGLLEKACALTEINYGSMNELRSLNVTLEQQVLEQFHEYERRLHPGYKRWSETLDAEQPFANLYQQMQVRETAYQLCVQEQRYEDECREARFKVDRRAKVTFAERHGLVST